MPMVHLQWTSSMSSRNPSAGSCGATTKATHRFSPASRKKLFVGAFVAWLIGWWILALLHGQLPYLIRSICRQFHRSTTLHHLKYQENWSLWIVVNLANILYWSILSIQVMTGATDIGSLGAYLSQVALQAALLFNSI